MKSAGELLLKQMLELKDALKARAIEHKNTICIGRSHGIHAEPTTMGLKFALWYEETKRNIKRLQSAIDTISVGQISGAVGTFDHLSQKLKSMSVKNGIETSKCFNSSNTRDRHAEFMNTLAVIGAHLKRFRLR
jgi:adenylosuccinate lyase